MTRPGIAANADRLSRGDRLLGSLLFWAALPLLAPQALWVKRSAARYPPAAGSNSGRFGTGKGIRLLAFGDSIIAGVGVREFEKSFTARSAEAIAHRIGAEVDWIADGYSGANSRRLLKNYVDTLPPGQFDYVLLSVGVNDVTSLSTGKTWRRNLEHLLDELTRRYDRPAIALAGIPPLGVFPLLPQPLRLFLGKRAALLDAAAREVVARFDNAVHVPVTFVPRREAFAGDGFHPSESSYVEFGERIADAFAAVDRRAGVNETTRDQSPAQ